MIYEIILDLINSCIYTCNWIFVTIFSPPYSSLLCFIVAIIICLILKKKHKPIKLIIGLFPYIFIFILAIKAFFLGYSFPGYMSIGIVAFVNELITDFYEIMPIIICSLGFLISYIRDEKKTSKKNK